MPGSQFSWCIEHRTAAGHRSHPELPKKVAEFLHTSTRCLIFSCYQMPPEAARHEFPSLNMSLESREDVPTPTPIAASWPALGKLAGIIGRPGFAIAIAAGLVLGFFMLPSAGTAAGALIALGPLAIPALAARWPLPMQPPVADLHPNLWAKASHPP